MSILKPIHGLDRHTYANLASFCRQDYPEYQVLFSVRDEQDPAVAVVRQVRRDFPDIDVQLIISSRTIGSNPKVSNLANLEAGARSDFLLICDSDIRVGRGYLRDVIQPMRDSTVGAVTCMCRSLSKGVVGTIEALWESTEFCPWVLVARKVEGVKFALGSTAVVRRTALERIGGFKSIADYLSDDFMLGHLIAKAGYQVALSRTVVEHELSLKNFVDLAQRQIRWNRGIRASRPWGYRGLLFTYGIPMSLLFLVFTRGSSLGWVMFGATGFARIVMAHVVGNRFLKDRAAKRFLWLVPVQDLISFVFWCFGLVGDTVCWRGQRFRLTRQGKLVPLPKGLPPASRSEVQGSRVNVSIPVAHQ